MLLARGFSQKQAALVLYGVCAAFGLLAMLFANTGTGVTGLILFVLCVVMIIAVGHLRYHEVDELRAGVKRTVADRRMRLANNIHVRRGARAVSKASDLHDVFETLGQMLEFDEFVCVTVLIGSPDAAEKNERALNAARLSQPKQVAKMRDGRIFWSWHQPQVELDRVLNSNNFWSLSLRLGDESEDLGSVNFYRSFDDEPLLLDANYLIGLFRNELSAAIKRILANQPQVVEPKGLAMTATAGKV
jgi:hypothetical protein